MQIKIFGARGEKNIPVHCFEDRGEGEFFWATSKLLKTPIWSLYKLQMLSNSPQKASLVAINLSIIGQIGPLSTNIKIIFYF